MRRNSTLLLSALALSTSAHLRAESPKEFSVIDKAVRVMAISPDEKTIAVGGGTGEIALWDVAAEKVQRNLKKHVEVIKTLMFTQEGKTLISGGYDGELCFWSVETGELMHSVKTMGKIEDACLLNDGPQLAVSFDEGSEVQILNADTGKELRRVKTPFEEPIRALVPVLWSSFRRMVHCWRQPAADGLSRSTSAVIRRSRSGTLTTGYCERALPAIALPCMT